MSDALDFIVLGAHGSGLNAFHTFANTISGIECIDWKTSTDKLKASLHANTHNKKGLVVDRADIKRNGRLECILQNLSSDCLLICLVRDPCARFKSVVNTHIQWWAESVAGTFDLPLSSNRLFTCGDEITHLKSIIKTPTMNTQVELFQEFSTQCRDILFYDISDLFPQNAASTFQKLSEVLLGQPLENFSVPGCLPFSRENLFVKFIKPLKLEDNLKLKPCPVEFLEIYGYSQNDIVEKFAPDEYGFTLGDFPGDVALVPAAPKGRGADDPIYIYIYIYITQ